MNSTYLPYSYVPLFKSIKMKYILSLSTLILFSVNSMSAGGGWPTGKGKGYIKLAEWWVVSNKHYTDNRAVDPNTTRGIYNTTIYGEYGLSARWTAIAYIPVFSRSFVNDEVSETTGEVLFPGEVINGVGDAQLGIKYSFNTNKKLALSTTLFFGIPIGESAGGSSGTLQTGDGEFNQMLQFDAGTGFNIGGVNGYANVFAGYNNRTNGFSDEFRLGGEVGANFIQNKVGFTLRVASLKSTDNGQERVGENRTSIFSNNAEFVSISPEIRYNISEKWGVSANYATASSGRLIFASPSYEIGVYHQW